MLCFGWFGWFLNCVQGWTINTLCHLYPLMINSENEWLWAGRVENVGFAAAAGKEMEIGNQVKLTISSRRKPVQHVGVSVLLIRYKHLFTERVLIM